MGPWLRHATPQPLYGGLLHPESGQYGDSTTSWCEEDPIVELAGQTLNIVTRVPQTAASSITGPVTVTLTLPANHPLPSITCTANGFFKEQVVVLQHNTAWNTAGPNRVVITTHVPAADQFPIQLSVTAQSRETLSEGKSNTALSLEYLL